jgi:hypothetical protein
MDILCACVCVLALLLLAFRRAVGSYKRSSGFRGGVEENSMLGREYARYKATQEILLLEKNDRYFDAVERLMLLMAADQAPRQDPIYLDLPADHAHYRIFYGGPFDDENAGRIVEKIRGCVRAFLGAKYPTVTPTRNGNLFSCGEFSQAVQPEIVDWMYSKLVDNPRADELVLAMLMRYASMVNRYSHWTLPDALYEHAGGWAHVEGLATPLSARLCHKNPAGVFYTLFEDTDGIFGGENVFAGNFAAGIISFPADYEDRLMPRIKLALAEGSPVIFVSRRKFFGLPAAVEMSEVAWEDHTMYEQPLSFSMGPAWVYHRVDEPTLARLKPTAPNPLEEKLQVEFDRLLAVEAIVALYKPAEARNTIRGKTVTTSAEKNLYEWKNIVERFLLTMANIAQAEVGRELLAAPAAEKWTRQGYDHVFARGEALGVAEAYDKLVGEIADKNISVDDAAAAIRAIIDRFFARSGSSSPVTYSYAGTAFTISRDGHKYVKNLDRERYRAMITKLNRTRGRVDHNAYLAVAALRYECILAGSQHWNIPFTYYEHLYRRYGLAVECFASPFNSQLLLLQSLTGKLDARPLFCSLFYDTDQCMGSHGSIFEFDPAAYRAQTGHTGTLTLMLNPPYVESLIDAMCDRIDFWMKLPHMRIFTGIPSWRDANFYRRLKSHRDLVATRDLSYGEFYYEDSANLNVTKIMVRSGYSIFAYCNAPLAPGEPGYETLADYLRQFKY